MIRFYTLQTQNLGKTYNNASISIAHLPRTEWMKFLFTSNAYTIRIEFNGKTKTHRKKTPRI